MIPSEFKRLRKEELSMTQLQLANKLGVSKDTVSNIERGYNVPVVYGLAIRQLVWLRVCKILTAW